MKKRIVSVFLAIVLAITLVPVSDMEITVSAMSPVSVQLMARDNAGYRTYIGEPLTLTGAQTYTTTVFTDRNVGLVNLSLAAAGATYDEAAPMRNASRAPAGWNNARVRFDKIVFNNTVEVNNTHGTAPLVDTWGVMNGFVNAELWNGWSTEHQRLSGTNITTVNNGTDGFSFRVRNTPQINTITVTFTITGIDRTQAPARNSSTIVADFRTTAGMNTANSLFYPAGHPHPWSNGGDFNCVWRPQNITHSANALNIRIDSESDNSWNFSSGEYRSHSHYRYGYYEVSMQPIRNIGVVSAFFTYTGPSEGNRWNEVDIEFLGRNTTQVQFDIHNYADKAKTNSRLFNRAHIHNLGFDASAGFNTYGFHWLPNSITWYVNGVAVYTANTEIPNIHSKIMINAWPGIGVDDWLGRFNGNVPLTARYQWLAFTPASPSEIIAAPPPTTTPPPSTTTAAPPATTTPATTTAVTTASMTTAVTTAVTVGAPVTTAIITTPVPEITTPAPEITTPVPEITTSPPEIVITPPPISTEPPPTFTQPPLISTEPPQTSTEPTTSTEPPPTFTQPPLISTEPPTTSTEPPVVTRIPGDVDGNGVVTITDALEILMYLAGMDSALNDLDNFNAARAITGGEKPTISDALEILMYLAGMESVIGKPVS
jgi:beta-glucanase (GH16 family)